MKDYDRYDATALAKLVRERQVSAAELLDAAIARTEAVNPRVNAVVARHYDEARAALRAGLPEGPFHGVPFLLKDLNALLAGTVTSNGCRFFADNRADHDTELVARYKRGGLNIFGKTNTPEFGLTVTTEPRLLRPHAQPLESRLHGGRLQRRVRPRRSRPASCPLPTLRTAAARSASRPRAAACSGSSPRARATRTARTVARAGRACPPSTSSRAACATARRCWT